MRLHSYFVQLYKYELEHSPKIVGFKDNSGINFETSIGLAPEMQRLTVWKDHISSDQVCKNLTFCEIHFYGENSFQNCQRKY